MSQQKTKYSEDWNEYLDKYYLNIKMVKPILKYEGHDNREGNLTGIDGNKIITQQGYERDAKSSAEMMLLTGINKMPNHPTRTTSHLNSGT